MTDAGSFLPKPDGSAASERARLLRQIATALDLPVAALGEPAPEGAAGVPSNDECAAMLTAFSRIDDPQLRTYCLQIVEGFAKR